MLRQQVSQDVIKMIDIRMIPAFKRPAFRVFPRIRHAKCARDSIEQSSLLHAGGRLTRILSERE